MKKFILNLILILLVSIQGYSQSGNGYVNYRAVRTHYGNGNTSQYPQHAMNSAQFDLMFDLTNPANTLIGQGEVDADTSQGFAGGHPPYTNGQSGNVGGEYFAVEYTGWFLAKATGNYLFYLYTDDSSEIWIGDTKVASRYGGAGSTSGWITLQANTWYPLMMRYQEYGGADYGYLQMYSSMFNGYFYPGHASYPISNQAPVYPHKLDVTYNLNNSLDKTKFKSYINILDTSTTPKNLSANGVVNYTDTNGLDATLYPTSKRATTVGGQVEWMVIYGFDATNQRYRIGIDKREFPAGFDFTKLTELQIFDIYDGPIEYKSNDAYWVEYYWYRSSQYPWSSSSYYANYMRAGNGFLALKAEFSFEDVLGFTPHEVVFDVDQTYWSNQNIISIQDIALSFSELTSTSNGPGFGGGGGKFTTGIEYLLGDVNQDGSFDFQDTYLMLQHLFGETDPFANQTFEDKLRMFESGYDTWPTNGWSNNIPNTNKFIHTLDENNKEKTKSFDVAFLGDVNFSHSHQPSNLTTTAKSSPTILYSKTESGGYIGLDIVNNTNEIEVTLEIPQNNMNISGTQFKVYFDNTKLEYQSSEYSNTSISNFSSKRDNYINIGSFSSDGSQTLNGGMLYKLKFKSNSELNSTLGLVVVGFSELVNKDGTKIQWVIQ